MILYLYEETYFKYLGQMLKKIMTTLHQFKLSTEYYLFTSRTQQQLIIFKEFLYWNSKIYREVRLIFLPNFLRLLYRNYLFEN